MMVFTPDPVYLVDNWQHATVFGRPITTHATPIQFFTGYKILLTRLYFYLDPWRTWRLSLERFQLGTPVSVQVSLVVVVENTDGPRPQCLCSQFYLKRKCTSMWRRLNVSYISLFTKVLDTSSSNTNTRKSSYGYVLCLMYA